MAKINEIKTVDEYISAINQEGISVIKFWAEWCMPCKALNRTIESLPDDVTNGVTFYGVDTDLDEFADVCVDNKVRNLPTMLIYKDGEIKERVSGALPMNKIIEVLNSVRNVDC